MLSNIEVASSTEHGSGRSGSERHAVVVGVFQAEKKDRRPSLDPGSERFDASGAIADALERPEFGAEAGKVMEVFAGPTRGGRGESPRVFVAGLGRRHELNAESMRLVGAAIARKCAETRRSSVSIELEGALRTEGVELDPGHAGKAVGEAFGLLACDFDAFRGKGTERKPKPEVVVGSSDERFLSGLRLGAALARSANVARRLSNSPPNVATPAHIAEVASEVARRTGMRADVFEGSDLDKHGLTGLMSVGRASENKPCLIRLEYTPRGRYASERPLVLVGKTMTYDTGGLSLKVNNGMRGMKGDKDGGCAVLGAMHAIATVVKPSRPVVALLATAENSVSDNAYRPDDVYTYRNGVTVEVTNTDAEGRLVLADALCWAVEEERASAIVDVATLTGGVIVALGSTYAGMFCEHDGLRAKVEQASAASGERVWRLPMHREYREMMKSTIADIINSNPERKAHPIQGAAFLSYFVPESTPWCHLDIAGVHRSEADRGMFVKDVPTGWGVRLLAELAARY